MQAFGKITRYMRTKAHNFGGERIGAAKGQRVERFRRTEVLVILFAFETNRFIQRHAPVAVGLKEARHKVADDRGLLEIMVQGDD
jgi:hypothetical protein